MRVPALVLALAVCFVAAPSRGESELEGRITVRSPVAGATVLVDDQPVGVVPLAPFDLRFGSHIITVKKEGLISFEKQIRLRTGEHLIVDALPTQARSLLTIDAGPITGGVVRLDGQPLGPLPVVRLPIAPGRHTLEIDTPGHEPVQKGFVAPAHEEYVARPAFVSAVAQGANEELELELPQENAPAKAATTIVLRDDELTARPSLTALAAPMVPAPATTFVADPIAHEEVRRPTAPIYKKAWFWAATGAVAVAAVAIPVLAGGSGYQEVRDPSAACGDCLAVLNR